MKKMTEKNLKKAFAGESQAHMKYHLFSEVAEQEGKPNIARLFKAISHAEKIHARNHLRELHGIGSTTENLLEAFEGEEFEVEEMYPAHKSVSELQGEKGATRSNHFALEAERIHMAMYLKAREASLLGEDLKIGDIYICGVCGYTAEDDAPVNCPICNAKKEMFKKF